MSLTGGSKFILTGGVSQYPIARSLRFRRSNASYLNRTSGASPTNNKIWTFSFWMKRCDVGALSNTILTNSGNTGYFVFDGTDFTGPSYTLTLGGGSVGTLTTNAMFRDPGAWLHIVLAVDTTQGTAANRGHIYINGVEATYSTNSLTLNGTVMNAASAAFRIGADTTPSLYMDGYLAEVNFIDGQQLTPSSFGQTDATTGAWNPIKYTGTYGTNGFYLPFTYDAGNTGGIDGNTKLALHLDNATTDSSATTATVSLSGTAAFSTTKTMFGTYGLSYGSNGYVSVTNNSTLNNFTALTIDMWSDAPPVFNTNGVSTYAWLMVFDGTSFYMSSTNAGWNLVSNASTGWTSTAGVMTHFAITWDGTNIRFYQNGNLTATVAVSTGPGTTGPWSFGASQAQRNNNGYIDEIRVSNVVRWTSNFVPSQSAYSTETIGKDSSGNGNNWTPTNISVTAGVTNDSLVDTPTNYGTDTGAGGEVRGNYATLNPLQPSVSSLITLSAGNLQYNFSGSSSATMIGTVALPIDQKIYFEASIDVDANNCLYIGAILAGTPPTQDLTSTGTDTYMARLTAGTKFVNASSSALGATPVVGDTVGFSWDGPNGNLNVYSNTGALIGALATGISPTKQMMVAVGSYVGSARTSQASFNFGQRPFKNTAPSGFKALCTQNLSNPAILKPSLYMDVNTRAGTGAAFSVTGKSFQPDLVWMKGRSGATSHALFDSVRGAQADLATDSTAAEVTDTQGLSAFNSDGFSGGTLAKINTSAATYVDWMWKKGATPGFDIVSYAGNGSNRTISHALGVAPKLVIVKNRTTAARSWAIWHTAFAGTDGILFDTAAKFTDATVWNSTTPTSSVFSVGTHTFTNTNTDNYIAYCFAEVAGFSKFGSYTGNGSTDGPFVFCGFRPRWIMIKLISGVNQWFIFDTARDTYNPSNLLLQTNTSIAELGATLYLDILSNGFKIRGTDPGQNTSSGTCIFAAFAESPFKTARAR